MPEWIEDRDISPLTTFGIGGPARWSIEVKTVAEMQEALRFCSAKKLPFFILGKGSNCLFDDRGLNAALIINKIDFMEESEGRFHVGAGYSFSRLGALTARRGYTGLEFASGIPGSVGGAVFMNAGANGTETCESLVSVDFVDESGMLQTLPKEKLRFAYRTSSFHSMRGAIVGATFELTPCKEAREKQLKIIEYRTNTQPYGDKSAGCIFRNPTGDHAGALIEKSGLKGFSVGGATVSPMHANFIVNKEGASAQNVLKLIQSIQSVIKEKWNVDLENEVRYIPYDWRGL